jgi:hypothetical protein
MRVFFAGFSETFLEFTIYKTSIQQKNKSTSPRLIPKAKTEKAENHKANKFDKTILLCFMMNDMREKKIQHNHHYFWKY